MIEVYKYLYLFGFSPSPPPLIPIKGRHRLSRLSKPMVREVCIPLGGFDVGVAQDLFDVIQRHARVHHRTRKAVPQVMHAHIRQISPSLHGHPEPADFLDGLARHVTGKKPWIAPGHD